jgi:hypothetical protein
LLLIIFSLVPGTGGSPSAIVLNFCSIASDTP